MENRLDRLSRLDRLIWGTLAAELQGFPQPYIKPYTYGLEGWTGRFIGCIEFTWMYGLVVRSGRGWEDGKRREGERARREGST